MHFLDYRTFLCKYSFFFFAGNFRLSNNYISDLKGDISLSGFFVFICKMDDDHTVYPLCKMLFEIALDPHYASGCTFFTLVALNFV